MAAVFGIQEGFALASHEGFALAPSRETGGRGRRTAEPKVRWPPMAAKRKGADVFLFHEGVFPKSPSPTLR